MKAILLSMLWLGAGTTFAASGWPSAEEMARAFDGREGTFVLRECGTGREFVSNAEIAARRFPPCSSFKIWNSLIGLETGVLVEPDAPFWTWDHVERSLPGWNKDQTWRSAFAVSCVPAFQALARNIGAERMQTWLDQLDYGDCNMAARPDSFWLPREGVGGVLISPQEQAALLGRLLEGKLPVRPESVAKLKDVMQVGPHLYGKTGSGLVRMQDAGVDYDTGWFVGFVENKGRTFTFACLLLGPGLGGKDARAVTERILKDARLL